MICDLSEVLVCLPFAEGHDDSRCSRSFGGSESGSQQMVNMSICSEIQGDF